MKILPVIIAAICLALTGCVSSKRDTPVPTPRVQQDVPRIGLSSQTLRPNECGLFLWSRTPPVRFVFFAKSDSGSAKILIGEEEVRLVQTGASGEIFGEFMTVMDFRFESGTDKVNLSVTPGEQLDGGQRISEGRLVTVDAEGWETILPVAGVRACQVG